jgi:hypothetical protein
MKRMRSLRSAILSVAVAGLILVGNSGAHAFDSYWYYTYTQTGGSADSEARYELGLSPRVCFLSRIAGTAGGGTMGSEAYMTEENGMWYVTMRPKGGSIEVNVICLPTSPTMTDLWMVGSSHWFPGQPPKLLPAVNGPNTVCGLTGVAGGTGFKSTNDSVKVYQSNGSWYISGTGNAYGTAICASVTSQDGNWWWVNPPAGSNQILLTNAPNTGTNPLGTQCFLTGVSGNFTAKLGAANDRVSVDYSAQDGWRLNVGTGKGGWVTCIR